MLAFIVCGFVFVFFLYFMLVLHLRAIWLSKSDIYLKYHKDVMEAIDSESFEDLGWVNYSRFLFLKSRM